MDFSEIKKKNFKLLRDKRLIAILSFAGSQLKFLSLHGTHVMGSNFEELFYFVCPRLSQDLSRCYKLTDEKLRFVKERFNAKNRAVLDSKSIMYLL